ncbi:MAG: hypothetical protein LBC02_04485, partial [Planctomycetaceae bacterium]|nr:hypothetical protein [Planctomycetaceae bacterium]
MFRNFVRLSALTFVFGVIFCAAVLAQTSSPVTYHIWDTDNLPNGSTTEKYYRYLSRPADAPTNQLGLYQVVPYFGGYGYYIVDGDTYSYYSENNQSKIVLHNNDSTLLNQTFQIGNSYYYIDDEIYQSARTSVTVESNKSGELRTITSTNAPLFYLYNNSQLNISNDIIISRKEDDSGSTSSYYGGAIYLQGGELNAQKVSFSSCLNTSYYGGAITAYGYNYGYEDDLNYNYRSRINVDGANFTGNRAAYGGGAIYLNQGDLTGNGATFSGNAANENYYGYGGAIYLTNSTATLENATFTNNIAGYGGAISSENSNLYLKGTNFTLNNATGYGGAIFFQINDSGYHTLQLGAFEKTSVAFADNKQLYDSTTNTGTANSIAFYGGGTVSGTANVSVDVEGNDNHFNMRDPLSVVGGNIHLRFTKTGEGSWNLSGVSNLTQASSVLFNINRGTFRLGNDAQLNIIGELNQFNVRDNATLSIGDWAGSGNAATLSTPHFQMDTGSTLWLDQTLNLNVLGSENVIKGTVTGNGDLNVNVINEGGVLKFSGQTSNYSGDLNIQSGTFWADSSFKTTGSVNLAANTILMVTANSNATNIVA